MTEYADLGDKVVIVTGAARGLGAATVRAFAAQDARLAIVDVDAAALGAVAEEFDHGPDRVLVEVVDLADSESYEPLVERASAHFGRLDVLVNNAALLVREPMEDITVDTFERHLRINLVAPYLLARAAIERMRHGGRGGRIVNVASMAGRTGGVADIHPYAASKGGLLAVTKSLAKAAAPDGILVNAILPSNIESPMLRDIFPPEAIARTLSQVPLGRTAEPEEVAELILWLSSEASSYVTGVNWDINGGWYMS